MKWFVCICWVNHGIFVTSLLRQRGQLLLLEGVVGTLRFECDNHRLVIRSCWQDSISLLRRLILRRGMKGVLKLLFADVVVLPDNRCLLVAV